MIEKSLREKLQQAFSPVHMELINESHMHRHHHGMKHHPHAENGETHFQLILVSNKFEGLARIDRQRLVNDLLKEEFQQGLHALTMKTYAPAEWKN